MSEQTSETSPHNCNVKIPTLYGLVALIILTFHAGAQNFSHHFICATNPPDFGNLSSQEADKAVMLEDTDILLHKTKTVCAEYFTNLVDQIRRGKLKNENEVLAIWLLGELRPRDTNSIETLIDIIDFKALKFDPATRVSRWGSYPAQEALIRIGTPVVNPVLQHLRGESNELRRHLMCDVLIQVEGKKGTHFNASDGKAIARVQIKQQADAESDPTKHRNLEAALKELDK